MALCNKCNNNRCNGSCGKRSITRQIRIENNSIGRDGESAYEAYVRLGGTLTEQEWMDSLQGQDGDTPYIGGNGNWWIKGTDTGVSAEPEELAPESDDDIFSI